MNSTLTRIAVTMKNYQILPTPSSKKIGALPTITYKATGNRCFAKNQTVYSQPEIAIYIDDTEVEVGALFEAPHNVIARWAKSLGVENPSIIIR
jgi:hypothetical protein